MIVKHANPCGVAVGEPFSTPMTAPSRPIRPRHSAASSPSTGHWTPITAKAIVDRQFVEVIIAPEITPEALAATASKMNDAGTGLRSMGQRGRQVGFQAGHRRFAGAGP